MTSLPANDPLGVQASIVAELHKLAARTARRTPAVLEAVFVIDMHADSLVRHLTTQYVEHAGRSPKIEHQLWHALSGLAHGFSECYAAFSREISDPVPRNKWQAVLPPLIGRQIRHLSRDAKLRLYRSERWSDAKWTELFTPFMRACSLRIDREPLRLDPMGVPTTVERQLLMLLVLQLADPGNLEPRQIEWIAAHAEAWCQALRFTLKPTSANTFYVDLAGTTGLRRRALTALEGRVLFVDLEPLHVLMLKNRVALEEAVRSEPRSTKKSQQREELDLFVKLSSRVDPEFKPLARRGERKSASGPVDAVVGFANITSFVRSDMALSVQESNSSRNFGNTMELAVFGRSRAGTELQRELGVGRVSLFATSAGPWEMKDISASGYRLHAPINDAMELTLNMLVAIHRHGDDGWVMGIVRRMRRLSARNAEIGLQLIATTLASAELTEQKKTHDASYSVKGENPAVQGRQFHGLFLSFRRRPEEAPVQSLVVPSGEYHPSRRYTLRTGQSVRTIRHGRLLEEHTGWVWTVIDNVTPEADAGSSRPAA